MSKPRATVVRAPGGFQLRLDGNPACDIIYQDGFYEFIKPRELHSTIAFQLNGIKVPDTLSVLVALADACRNYRCNFEADDAAIVLRDDI
jgi:hypothetical protein